MLKIMITAVIIIAALFSANSFASESGAQKLFEKKCSRCHTLNRALTKTKDLEAWKRTTTRMSKYSKGEITLEEAEIIAEYLASCPPEK
jgi:phage FluMu protein Com